MVSKLRSQIRQTTESQYDYFFSHFTLLFNLSLKIKSSTCDYPAVKPHCRSRSEIGVT